MLTVPSPGNVTCVRERSVGTTCRQRFASEVLSRRGMPAGARTSRILFDIAVFRSRGLEW
jgi:hypothetical protein